MRLGADIGIKCQTCGRRVLLPRRDLERRMKLFVSRAAAGDDVPEVVEPASTAMSSGESGLERPRNSRDRRHPRALNRDRRWQPTRAACPSSAAARFISGRARQLPVLAALDRSGCLADREQYGRLLAVATRRSDGRFPPRRAGEHRRQLRDPGVLAACGHLWPDRRRGCGPREPAKPDGHHQRCSGGTRRAVFAGAADLAGSDCARLLLRHVVPVRGGRSILHARPGRLDSRVSCPAIS